MYKFVNHVRDADHGEMNCDQAHAILNGEVSVQTISMKTGALILFGDRNSSLSVTPTQSDGVKVLAVLA